MGSFFTNVQVYTGGRAAEEVHASIVAALRQRAHDAGLEEDDSLSDEEAERAALIAPPGPEPWIAVYDELTDDQDPEILRDLGEALSQIGGAAITVLVHDSDILEMRLCHDGEQVDLYNSYPNYFDQDPDKTREPVTGDAARWRAVLAPGATVQALQSTWETREIFAELALPRIAGLLGWNQDRCTEGFRYLAQVADDLTGFTRLAFRPSAVTAQSRPPLFAEGPPRFVQGAWSPETTVMVGGSGTAHAGFQSAGGAGRGLQVVLWGPALDDALVQPRTARLTWREDGAFAQRELPLEAGQSADGIVLWHAQADDIPIPAGLSDAVLGYPSQRDPEAYADLESATRQFAEALRSAGLTMHGYTDIQFATEISVRIEMDGVKPGTAELHIGVTPLQDQGGQMSQTITVNVQEG